MFSHYFPKLYIASRNTFLPIFFFRINLYKKVMRQRLYLQLISLIIRKKKLFFDECINSNGEKNRIVPQFWREYIDWYKNLYFDSCLPDIMWAHFVQFCMSIDLFTQNCTLNTKYMAFVEQNMKKACLLECFVAWYKLCKSQTLRDESIFRAEILACYKA